MINLFGIVFDKIRKSLLMKSRLLTIVIVIIHIGTINAQEWMRSLSVAQDLAMVQNKMVLMVWEDATTYEYPVTVNDNKGRTIRIRNLFTDEEVTPLIWEHFVPVIVNEDKYEELFLKIKDKRTQDYIDKFNDNSIKIMDINGNILNVNFSPNYQNITGLILNYGLNTEYINSELKAYRDKPDFYSAYFIAEKYLDIILYLNFELSWDFAQLSKIYAQEAAIFIETDTSSEDKAKLTQRLMLLEIKSDLITKNPRRARKKMKLLEKEGIMETNLTMYTYLKYITNAIFNRSDKNRDLLSNGKLSSRNLKNAERIIKINS